MRPTRTLGLGTHFVRVAERIIEFTLPAHGRKENIDRASPLPRDDLSGSDALRSRVTRVIAIQRAWFDTELDTWGI